MHAERIDIIEVAARILFEAGDVLMRFGDRLNEITKILVEIRFTIGVCVAEPCDLIPPEHINLIVNDLESERLIKTGGEALPGQFTKRVVNASDLPNITVDRADVRRAIAGEIHTGKEHERLPWVVVGNGKCVDCQRASVR